MRETVQRRSNKNLKCAGFQLSPRFQTENNGPQLSLSFHSQVVSNCVSCSLMLSLPCRHDANSAVQVTVITLARRVLRGRVLVPKCHVLSISWDSKTTRPIRRNLIVPVEALVVYHHSVDALRLPPSFARPPHAKAEYQRSLVKIRCKWRPPAHSKASNEATCASRVVA